MNALERAWKQSLAGKIENGDENGSESGDDLDDIGAKSMPEGTNILHRSLEYFQLPAWDYGARTGVGELGRVKINYWVINPAGRSSQQPLRSWVDPNKTILMTLDGQTHAEESRAIVTGQSGAKL